MKIKNEKLWKQDYFLNCLFYFNMLYALVNRCLLLIFVNKIALLITELSHGNWKSLLLAVSTAGCLILRKSKHLSTIETKFIFKNVSFKYSNCLSLSRSVFPNLFCVKPQLSLSKLLMPTLSNKHHFQY